MAVPRLSDVQHQPRAIELLRRALGSGRTHHALLFEGPEGVGRELAATALAARLLCQSIGLPAAADACGECESCRMFAAGSHPDFHLVHRSLIRFHPDAKVRTRTDAELTVPVIEHFLVAQARLAPAHGRHRVFVIRDAQLMNEHAANALLKTLEEPPAFVCIILISTSGDRLLSTIRSRVQRIEFGLLPAGFVEQRLGAEADIEATDARTLATISGGSAGVALAWRRLGMLDTFRDLTQLLAEPSALDNPEQFGKALSEMATDLVGREARLARAQQVDEPADEIEDDEEDDEDASSRSGAGGGSGGRSGAGGGGASSGGDEADGGEETSGGGGSGASSSKRKTPVLKVRRAMRTLMALSAPVLREALNVSVGSALPRALPAHRVQVDLLARRGPDALAASINALHRAEAMLDQNVAPQLVGEWFSLALAGDVA